MNVSAILVALPLIALIREITLHVVRRRPFKEALNAFVFYVGLICCGLAVFVGHQAYIHYPDRLLLFLSGVGIVLVLFGWWLRSRGPTSVDAR